MIGGGGGGRTEMAQAGGRDPGQARAGAGSGRAFDRSGRPASECASWPLTTATARIGCAISDPSGTLATPLPVIEPPEPRSVVELVPSREVELVLVGLPLHLSGEEGSQAALTRSFCAELADSARDSSRDLRRAPDHQDGRDEPAPRGKGGPRLPRRRPPARGLPGRARRVRRNEMAEDWLSGGHPSRPRVSLERERRRRQRQAKSATPPGQGEGRRRAPWHRDSRGRCPCSALVIGAGCSVPALPSFHARPGSCVPGGRPP